VPTEGARGDEGERNVETNHAEQSTILCWRRP
jgi:hypothetical protein